MTLKKDPKKEKQKQEENKRENLVAIIVVAIVVAVLGAWIYISLQTEPELPRQHIPVGVSPTLGDRNAPIQVVEFSDFECPFCSRFALETFPHIQDHYIDSGQIEFVYKHFPLTQTHGHALLASQAAECAADQDKFWEYHDILYSNLDALEVNQLLGYGEEVGVDMEAFRTCVINEERRDDILRDKDLGISLGVTGTPTFFFNGRRVVGDLSFEQFREEVESERGD